MPEEQRQRMKATKLMEEREEEPAPKFDEVQSGAEIPPENAEILIAGTLGGCGDHHAQARRILERFVEANWTISKGLDEGTGDTKPGDPVGGHRPGQLPGRSRKPNRSIPTSRNSQASQATSFPALATSRDRGAALTIPRAQMPARDAARTTRRGRTMASAPKPRLEGEDPDPDEDDLLAPLLTNVADEEAENVMADCMGGGAHRYHAQVILARFKRERWRIIREG